MNTEGEISRFDLYDDVQVDKLIKTIAGREFWKYKSRVSYSKIDYEDFYQQGWLVACDMRRKREPNDLNYFCVAVKRGMYRQVENSSSFTYISKEEKWRYIAGHEVRLDQEVKDGNGLMLGDLVEDREDVYSNIESKIIVEQVIFSLKEEDRREAFAIMACKKPISRKRRELLPVKALRILEGKEPYKQNEAVKKSKVSRVSYDKSKGRWVYYERINGKKRVLIRSRSQEEVEEFALSRII